MINNDFISADIWFARNGMKRNSSKYQAMVLGKNKGTSHIQHNGTSWRDN